MSTIGPERAAKLTAELRSKLPLEQTQHYDLVIENDLAGRAVLAVLWPHRTQLTVHIMTTEPAAKHVAALTSGLKTVRNAPEVVVIAPDDAHRLAASERLIWAVDIDRTDEPTRITLEQRAPEKTLSPFFTGFETLDVRRPDQMLPADELILRDVIRDHARFLNFFGDRFNAQDLYERSKYPFWITPPEGFDAALPQLWTQSIDPVGTVVERREFTGTLQLANDLMKQDSRVAVDFGPLGDIFNTTADLTVSVQNTLSGHRGLQFQVHRDHKLVHAIEMAPGESLPDIRLSAVRPDSSLSVSVLATQDHPLASTTSCTLALQLMVLPAGTHPVPSMLARIKAWLTGVPATI
ncbi:hypothetical protein [Enteractinococcus helveticum]|uniref:Uncharacterized protein n=1 Tax=Enteractinococcus helveticum TaxID=1837282 RepID=A0A1B7M3D9_9MICC|nr:hypothetical protein [Enteractinococcus helveticum]OAV63116.1 hypothetical protein A6F49_02880 [Enteractinococcus helveticum]